MIHGTLLKFLIGSKNNLILGSVSENDSSLQILLRTRLLIPYQNCMNYICDVQMDQKLQVKSIRYQKDIAP